MSLLIFACAAWAQPAASPPLRPTETSPASPPVEARSAAGPTAIEASALDTYLLRDSKGNLVPVLGMPFEEFERLMKLKRGLAPAAPPSYSLDTLTIAGKVEGQLATLQLTASIRVREAGWIRVPLRMNKAVLNAPPEHTGDGKLVVTCEPEGDGYLCWLQASPDEADEDNDEAEAPRPQQVKLEFVVPVEQVGDEKRLAITLPRATEGSVRVEAPTERAEASLRNGGEGIVSARSIAEGKSEITVLGAAGDIQLTWRPGRALPTSTGSSLEATGEILVKVEGRTRITSEVKLRVRSLGAAALETFRVRVPPGMELIPSVATGYSVGVVTPSSASAASDSRQIVEVKLERPATGSTEIRLAANLAAQSRAGASNEPACWEVLGAGRQRGTIDAVVDGDWLLQWTEDAGVRRVDTPIDTSAAGRIAARFEYFRQPCNLKLQVAQRPTRISVEPTYVLYVGAQQTRLEATLKYRIRGTRAQSLTIESGDWQLDRISPDAFVYPDALATTPGKPWQLPLTETAPAEMELKLEAHLANPVSGTPLLIGLPRPQADIAAPATVVVVPDDNVELIPNTAAIRGLTPDVLPASIKLPPRQQSPLVFRDLGGNEPAQLAAQFQLRSRKTAVNTETVIQLDRQRMHVSQRLAYRIAYEPQRVFELSVPAELQRASGLHVVYGTDILPLEPVTDEAARPGASAYRFVAPAELIGPCEFIVQYTLPLPSLSPNEPTSIRIPLPAPADHDDSEFSNHSIAVNYADGLQLDSLETTAEAKAGSAEPKGIRQLQLPLLHPVGHVDVSVSEIESQRVGAASIEKAWIQTWLSQESRQDRATWRFSTQNTYVRVELPSGADLDAVQVALNGRPLEGPVREQNVLQIALPPDVQGAEVILEVWYVIPRRAGGWGWMVNDLQPPQLDGGAVARRLFWQVCLPAQEHLLTEPAEFAAELQWSWQGLYWERQSTLSQRDLEQWVSATSQPELPSGVNQYLFSGFGRPTALHLITASQRLVVSVIAVLALVMGLVLIHVASARSPVVLLVGALGLLAVAVSAPELAAFLGQAAMIGLIVVLASGFASWLIWGWRSRIPASPSPASVTSGLSESKTAAYAALRPERASPSTTAAATLGMATEPRP